jgi:predicted nucleotidyltransferase
MFNWRHTLQGPTPEMAKPSTALGRKSGIMERRAMSPTVHLGDAQVDAAKLADLCRRFGVRELSLFGSAVRGELGPDSDIDVLVEFDPAARIGIVKFESLVEGLEALVGRKIDLVTKRGLKPWVRPEVLREARVVYAA